MKRPVTKLFSLALPLLAILFSSVVSAQTKGGQPNPGVTPIRQLDRQDVRVTRVEVDAGAVRSSHTHDDVRFHLFIPVSGKLELTIAKQNPVVVTPGQVIYIEKGTPHGFRNLGTTKAVIMEVFVKADSTAADERHVIELVRSLGASN